MVLWAGVFLASRRQALEAAGLASLAGPVLKWAWLGISGFLILLGSAGGWIWSPMRPEAETDFVWQGSPWLLGLLLACAVVAFGLSRVGRWQEAGLFWTRAALWGWSGTLVLGAARGALLIPLEAHKKTWKAKLDLSGDLIGHPLTQNGITCFLLLGGVFLLWQAAGVEYWTSAWARIRLRRLGMAGLWFLTACGAVGVLDSVSWSAPVLGEEGRSRRDPEGKVIYEPVRLTALDRLLAPLRVRTERSFSSPLADRLLDPVTETAPDGTVLESHPALSHPGSHLLGTDRVGDDILFRTLKGVRTALVIGIVPTLLATPLAMAFGISAGYLGRRWDDLVQFLYTVLACIPDILLMVVFMLIFEKGLTQLCIILGITSWVGLCRLLRGETLKLRELDYVQAARALGASGGRVMVHHLAPNLMHIVLISAVLRFSGMVLAEAVLTYLNVGVDPVKTPSWGRMINMAQYNLAREPVVWWALTAAFLAMLLLVLAANLFGDAVRDALDPRQKGR